MSDDDFRLLFDASPRPTWVIDRETFAFMLVNDAACEHYGWTREEMLAMTVREIRPPDDLARLEAAVAKDHDSTDRLRGLGARHRTKDGRVLDVELDIRRLTFRGRRASLVVVSDVTGAADTERRFRLLVEHSPDGGSLVDEHGVIRYMSPGAERMLGLAPGEIVGELHTDQMHPDDLVKVVPFPPGETRTELLRVRRRSDETWRWVEATATNLTRDLTVRAYVSSFRDVTARVLSEQSLRRWETNFRALIERTPTLLIVHRKGRVSYVNPAAIAVLGYDSADELVGKPVDDLIHPDELPSIRARIERTIRDGVCAPGIARIRRRDGTYLTTEGEAVILDFDGEPSNVLLSRDMTERHEMFGRMAVANRLVSVGTLAAGVAHEINNPLSYVMSNLAVIADELPALMRGESRLSLPEVETLVADARDGTARVSAIVRELRALSRSDDETTGLVDVGAVLVSSLKIAATEAQRRARLVTTIDDELPPVKGNASRLGQVVLNLLVNASQAIPEGHANDNEIRVRASFHPPNVVIEIQDTGAGISRSVMPRIFDPFFTTKPIGVGTGLGLPISHEIVRSLGGAISVESTPGVGSTFRVVLPAVRDSSSPGVESSERQVTPRVLMIDDEVGMGRSTRILMARHYDITPVTRALEGLDRIGRGERFDAIVCDLTMPEMGGVEFYEVLVERAPQYAGRVVFVTGGAFTDQAREFLARTKHPRLEKPFSEASLREAIERVRRDPADATRRVGAV